MNLNEMLLMPSHHTSYPSMEKNPYPPYVAAVEQLEPGDALTIDCQQCGRITYCVTRIDATGVYGVPMRPIGGPVNLADTLSGS